MHPTELGITEQQQEQERERERGGEGEREGEEVCHCTVTGNYYLLL